jgi:RNA polymerase sigma factor (TIGR02999 family)
VAALGQILEKTLAAEDPPQPDLTLVLKAACAGDEDSANRLLPLLYAELRRLAEDRLRNTPPGNTLQPTALVHEAYLRLIRSGDPGWNGRNHFFGAAAQAMRDILVEQARRKAAVKHGGDRDRLDLSLVDPGTGESPMDILALDEALRRLEAQDPRKGRIVNLRYFAGLTVDETAAALEVSVSTIEHEWRFIKRWLYAELSDERRPPGR